MAFQQQKKTSTLTRVSGMWKATTKTSGMEYMKTGPLTEKDIEVLQSIKVGDTLQVWRVREKKNDKSPDVDLLHAPAMAKTQYQSRGGSQQRTQSYSARTPVAAQTTDSDDIPW